ncbi:MAG: CIA30 family protein [Bacteroidota bacterium]
MILTDFKTDPLEWQIVNDGVMGGISQSQMEVLENGIGRFSGIVSLENNGGFASIRAPLSKKPNKPFQKIQLKVKGDGQRYSFRIKTDDYFDGVTYKNDFTTQKGEWSIIKLAIKDFIPVWRGRQLTNIKPLDPLKMRQVGLLISDKQAGNFALLVDWIKLIE